ncbi:MAG: alpha/beta hydrolase [Planctomycetaceae bacterium]|jgi:acetyl esterase/lipase|nr:alpha/beta hydrolase [Planctomycetaceae bacterium]
MALLYPRILHVSPKVLCLLVATVCSQTLHAQETPNSQTEFAKSTFTYKTVGDVKIDADVYRVPDKVKRPVVVWIHGGALIIGTRAGVPPQLKDLAIQEGFIIVSLDYRLGPEAQLPEIVSDVTDALDWVHDKGPNLFHSDPSRLVVAGASAGGYLALMSGLHPKVKPNAIVSYWGFGDIDGDWTTKPSESYRKGKLIDKEVAWSGVGKEVLTSTNQENGRGRSAFFLYLKQTGTWVNALTGLDPKTDRDKLTPFCPNRNVTPEFPPTLFLHGTADIDVPVEQTHLMVAELKKHNIPQETIIIEGGGHGLWGGDKQKIEAAFARSAEYIREQLTK